MIRDYVVLMRLDRPIGIFLLLWPTLWGLWLASAGHPEPLTVIIFIAGVVLMRSAGCIMNDLADRDFDRFVKRTAERPLTSGKISPRAAWLLLSSLLFASLLLLLPLNPLTRILAVIAVPLAIIYPLLKRITHLPQVGLGIAFSWGIPMAFAAETNHVPLSAWVLFFTALLWPVIFDTLYAMVDQEDDHKIGIKSTALFFGAHCQVIIAILQMVFLCLLAVVGLLFHLSWVYTISLACVAVLFIYHQWLIKDNQHEHCFKAFLHNNWVGGCIFLGIMLSYL